MWDLIVSDPDHCLSFYFEKKFRKKCSITEVNFAVRFYIENSYILIAKTIITFVLITSC